MLAITGNFNNKYNQSIERDFRFAPAPHAGRYVSKTTTELADKNLKGQYT